MDDNKTEIIKYVMRRVLYVKLQKHYVWDESISSFIKIAWQCKAIEHYRALMCSFKKSKEKAMHASDSAWPIWRQAWCSLKFKARSEKFTVNRLNETRGHGCGISQHTEGSISHTFHVDRLVGYSYLNEYVSILQRVNIVLS